MKNKSIMTLFLLVLLSLAGFSQSVNYIIKGKVNRKHNGKLIKLYYFENDKKLGDSVLVANGKFSFSGNLSWPRVGKLTFGDREVGDAIDVFLSEGTIYLSAKDSIHYSSIKGTKLAEEHEIFAKRIRAEEDRFFGTMNNLRGLPKGDEQKAAVTKFLKELEVYTAFKKKAIAQFVKEYPASYVSLYYLNSNTPGRLVNYEEIYPVFSTLSPEVKATPLGKQFEERLLASKGKLTGEAFIDFVSTTPDGKQLSLKEIIGKNEFTLVDFWASWCGPCRKENPYVVKTFNEFKDKGFTVLSVSLDDDGKKWKDAIEKDGMPWYHVSSLKGWKEPAAALYNVRAIPQNVLVDSQGKIVATNLRGETLYNKVGELLK